MQKNRLKRRFFCQRWSECGDSNPGPPAPKAGALPTAQHPDMKLWDCPGGFSQSRRATNCATPGYEVVGWPGRILPNVARYQLRYTPIFLSSVFYHRAWRASGCHVSRCGGLGAALHRSHGCPALPPRCFRRWRRSATCTNCATPRYSFLLFFTAARGAVALFL